MLTPIDFRLYHKRLKAFVANRLLAQEVEKYSTYVNLFFEQ